MSEGPIERIRSGRWLGIYTPGSGVVFSRKPNTRTRIHEAAHKILGHTVGTMKIKDFVDKELAAEAYSYRAMDKPVTFKVAMPMASELVSDFGLMPIESTNTVIRGLKRMGINPSDAEIDRIYSVALNAVKEAK